jgi:hypothetical protein
VAGPAGPIRASEHDEGPQRSTKDRALLRPNASEPAFGIIYLLLANTVFAAELVNASTGIDDLLFARVKRVAGRTYFYREVVAEG